MSCRVANVGMIQRRGGAGLAAEALQRRRIASQIVGQELESDEAAQARVLGLVDHAHATAADLFQDAVVRDRLDHGEAASYAVI
jgi:hypothetical protein